VKMNGGKLGGLARWNRRRATTVQTRSRQAAGEKNIKLDKVNFLTGFVFSNINARVRAGGVREQDSST